jgi:hypothetical protein
MAKPSVICYADPNKPRTGFILQQFARGARGAVVFDGKYRPGAPAAFFGVQPHTRPAFLSAMNAEEDYYYIDNGYFSGLFKGAEYYRVTQNHLQYHKKIEPDYNRLKRQRVNVLEWQEPGSFILFCPPGQFWFEQVLGADASAWRKKMLTKLHNATDMMVVERLKPKNIHEYRASPAENALRGCYAVVTFSSNIALQAVLRGIPAYCNQLSAASHICNTIDDTTDLKTVLENPVKKTVSERADWAATLAANQWTLSEISEGKAWKKLNG